MPRFFDVLRALGAERLSWFGAGLAAASVALLGVQLVAAWVDSGASGLPPRIDVVQAAEATRTPFASATSWPSRTPLPTRTPWPTYTPLPTRTPWPTYTPLPTRTPPPT